MSLLIWLLFVSYPLILSREVDGCFITTEGFAVTLFTSVCVYFSTSLQWNVLSVKLMGKYLTPRSSEVFISFFCLFFPFIRMHFYQIFPVLFIYHNNSFLGLKFFISNLG